MYWTEFLTVALIHLLAVASPGPDFAVVVRESVTHGRRAGMFTAFGVGTAIFVHVGYSLLGIGIIGYAGNMKSASLSEEEKKKAVKDFNFTKGIFVALLAGFMSACFSIGLGFGQSLCFPGSAEVYKTGAYCKNPSSSRISSVKRKEVLSSFSITSPLV